ncbi:MAG: hypothetical protein LBM94_05720 [Propionibacteriaceae bacterium]|jgi:hypothetical protein|nr:hypothetical protein [Propionibacteriaceae bacterium]
MQADPEDFAFTTAYSPDRLLLQLRSQQRGIVMRLILLAVIIAYAGYTIYKESQQHEFDASTWIALGCVGGACAFVVVALLLISFAQPGTRKVTLSVVVVLVGLTALLVPPILLLRVTRAFSRYEVFADLTWSSTAIMVALGVGLAMLLAAGVMLALWRVSDGETHGFIARRLASASVMVIIVLHVATGVFVSYLSGKVTLLDIPPTVDMWYYQLFDDASVWSAASGLLLAFPVGFGASSVLQMAGLAWTISDMAVGQALRVDPAGLVVAASQGPVRIVWDDVAALSAQAHTSLPGHELVVRSDTGFSWKVPFIFLDSLPGSIDSAVRAATDNSWGLDVTRLNRVI